jgi:hypothetical protein
MEGAMMKVRDLPGADRTDIMFHPTFVLGDTITIRIETFDPDGKKTADEARSYRVVQAGTYWSALAEPIVDAETERKEAIWRAVQEIANGAG